MSKSASPINTNEIQCPFFKALGDASIVCESPIPSARSNVSYFRSRSRMAAHVIWHCKEANGGGCAIYQAVMMRYSDEKKCVQKDG